MLIRCDQAAGNGPSTRHWAVDIPLQQTHYSSLEQLSFFSTSVCAGSWANQCLTFSELPQRCDLCINFHPIIFKTVHTNTTLVFDLQAFTQVFRLFICLFYFNFRLWGTVVNILWLLLEVSRSTTLLKKGLANLSPDIIDYENTWNRR